MAVPQLEEKKTSMYPADLLVEHSDKESKENFSLEEKPPRKHRIIYLKIKWKAKNSRKSSEIICY